VLHHVFNVSAYSTKKADPDGVKLKPINKLGFDFLPIYILGD